MTARTEPRGRRGTGRGRGHNEGVTEMATDEEIRAALEAAGIDPDETSVTARPRNPAPDPSQGRGGNNGPTDYRTAPKAEFDAELRRLGVRPRSN